MDRINDLQDEFRRSAKSSLANEVLTKEVNGAQLSLQVSPCSWMYAGYGLQVQVTMTNGGNGYIRNKDILFEKATMQDLNHMLDTVKVKKCSRCGNHAFDPASIDTNRNGLCEKCFINDLNKDFADSQKAMDEAIATLDAEHKSKGFTHRVTAWVHPKQGGDDYQIDFFCKGKPTPSEIKKVLVQKKSAVFDDYKIVIL